jgi:hypothetical protein
MTPLQAKIAAIMGDRAMRRGEIIKLAGLEPSYASKLLPRICDALPMDKGRWVLWRIKPGLQREPTITERIQAVLDDVRDIGAWVNEIVYDTGLGLSTVKSHLKDGQEAGLFGSHLDPGKHCGQRRRWYLAQHKPPEPPERPPKKMVPPKQPKPRKPRPSLERSSLPSVRKPAQSLVKCVPIWRDVRYAAVEPVPHVVDPSDCRPWARYAG